MSTQDMEMYCLGAKCDFEEHFGILQSSAIQLLFLNRFMLHLLHNTKDICMICFICQYEATRGGLWKTAEQDANVAIRKWNR